MGETTEIDVGALAERALAARAEGTRAKFNDPERAALGGALALWPLDRIKADRRRGMTVGKAIAIARAATGYTPSRKPARATDFEAFVAANVVEINTIVMASLGLHAGAIASLAEFIHLSEPWSSRGTYVWQYATRSTGGAGGVLDFF